MTTAPHIDLNTITLAKGSHDRRDDGVCLLEAVAWWAGEPHTDRPRCVCPILAAYGRELNDVLPDVKRQALLPLVPSMVGTAGDGLSGLRSLLALDWLVRTYTPAWLRLVPALVPDADRLASVAPFIDLEPTMIGDVVSGAASCAYAAWDATGDATGDAIWDAAGDAARVAAGAAWDAARAATWAAAGLAARTTAWAAARAATGVAARSTTWEVWQPVAESLQASAVDLLGRMIDPAGGEA